MKTVLRLLLWAAIVLAGIYFLLPLLSTAEFSLSIRRDGYSLDAYRSVFSDPEFFATLGYSAVIAICTIIFGVVLVVPMAYFVHLRLPWLKPLVELVVMLPLVVPPIVLVFGYLKLFSSSSVLPLTSTEMGSNVLLICGYITLSLPYLYRAVDSGLQGIDARTLTDAATILGASPLTVIRLVILPNILVSVLSGAFLTFAVVISEFVMASLLTRPAFGTYIQKIGVAQAYEPAALVILSFAITWCAMGMIQLMARLAPQRHER